MDAAAFIDRARDRTGTNRDRAEATVRATLATLGTRIAPGTGVPAEVDDRTGT